MRGRRKAAPSFKSLPAKEEAFSFFGARARGRSSGRYMKIRKFHGLFFKAVFMLSLISAVLACVIAFHVMRVDGRILKNEILQKQETVARRLASVARLHIARVSSFFSIFTDLHTDLGGHEFLNQIDLDYLRRRRPSIFYLAALDASGQKVFSSGRPAVSFEYQKVLSDIVDTCIKQGKDYIGNVYRLGQNDLFLLMAFPVRRHLEDQDVEGVLVAELDLREMGQSLSQAYPLDMDAMLATSSGEIISYNGAPNGLSRQTPPELVQKLHSIKEQMGDETSGDVKLPDGKKILVASARLTQTDWTVYVDQPADLASQLFLKGTFNSSWDVLVIVLGMFLFVVGVSYLVIIPITRPLERLRKAAVRLRDEEDAVIKTSDVNIPNDEIGELASVLVQMSEVLQERRAEILSAQQQLSHVNQELEKRVEERTRELKAATGELVKSERLAAIGQMASIISHEIRNPLAVISNATRLLKVLVTAPGPKAIKQFSIIEAEIKQANSIISEVLGYARTRELILSTIDLNSYLREILLSQPVAPGLTVKEDIEPESVRIKVDAEEIKQALRNVISNAVESMQGSGTLTLGTRVGRRAVCIFVSDTGPGITEDVRHKMFAPFFTTKARGTGLGLAVVGKAVSRHKGKLFIKSELGKGTCFQIYLKIYRKPGDTNYGETN